MSDKDRMKKAELVQQELGEFTQDWLVSDCGKYNDLYDCKTNSKLTVKIVTNIHYKLDKNITELNTIHKNGGDRQIPTELMEEIKNTLLKIDKINAIMSQIGYSLWMNDEYRANYNYLIPVIKQSEENDNKLPDGYSARKTSNSERIFSFRVSDITKSPILIIGYEEYQKIGVEGVNTKVREFNGLDADAPVNQFTDKAMQMFKFLDEQNKKEKKKNANKDRDFGRS